jgi:aspartate/tyrosine/aromatic aminotransferase
MERGIGAVCGFRAVAAMRENHGIHLPADGRINIAGLNNTNLRRFIRGLLPHLEQGANGGRSGA